MTNDEIRKIQFGDGFRDLKSYELEIWDINETYSVEFFENHFINVTYISSDCPELSRYFSEIEDGNKIAIDLEWEDEIDLLQFCSSKFVLIIKHTKGPGNKIIYDFLNTHKFYGKGMHNDKKQLMKKFGSSFEDNMEDIALTRLVPYGYSENFVKMTLQFAGKPKADFKDVKITKSNWESSELSSRQILYAAFDVVALFFSYPNFPPPKEVSKVPKSRYCQIRTSPEKKIEKNESDELKITDQKDKVNNIGKKRMKKEALREKRFENKKQKTNQKVIYNPIEVNKTYSYICKSYNGIKSLIYLRSIFKNIDFVSLYEKKDGSCYLFLSLLEPLEGDYKGFNLQQLDQIPFNLSTCFDVLFFTNIPDRIANQKDLQKFFYCFGVDQLISFNDNYCRVETRNNLVSHRIRTFIPNIEIDGKLLEMFDFPYFLPKLRCSNIPFNFTNENIKDLFPKVQSFQILKSRQETDCKTAFLNFETLNDAKETLKEVNYRKINGNEILLSKWTDDVHIRLMRNFEVVDNNIDNSKDLYSYYSSYGKIHLAYYDPILKNGHVQYYNHLDAEKACKSCNNAIIYPEGYGIVVRDLSFKVTVSQLIEVFGKFGDIKTLVFRDLYYQNMLSVVDITYSSPENPPKAKKTLDRTKLVDSLLHISVHKREAITDWKMSQKNQWVKFDNLENLEKMLSVLQPFGNVIDYNIADGKFYAMLDSLEGVQEALKKCEIKCEAINNQDFVFNTNNKGYDIINVRPVKEVKKEPRFAAIEIDPLPNGIDLDFINKLCVECGDYEPYIINSLIENEMKRLVLYCSSNRMIKKIYTLLVNTCYNDSYLRPRKVELDEIKDAPKPKKGIYFIGDYRITQNVVIIDPLPSDFPTKEAILNFIESKDKIDSDIIINHSAFIIDKMRAILIPKSCSERTVILRGLSRPLPNGEYIHVFKVSPDKIPDSLQ